jgi:hypothetical protein
MVCFLIFSFDSTLYLGYSANKRYTNSNQADLRILSQIHKQLGIKSPERLLLSHKAHADPALSSGSQKTNASPSRAQRNLRVFAHAVRAIARMRINSKAWGEHEKTRKRLEAAWEETKKREPVRRWMAHHDEAHESDDDNGDKHLKQVKNEARPQTKGRKRKSGRTGGDDQDACVTLDL